MAALALVLLGSVFNWWPGAIQVSAEENVTHCHEPAVQTGKLTFPEAAAGCLKAQSVEIFSIY